MAKLSLSGEPRNSRLAVLVTSTTRGKLEKVAAVQRASVNNVINDAIDKYLEEHRDDIQRYNDFFGEER